MLITMSRLIYYKIKRFRIIKCTNNGLIQWRGGPCGAGPCGPGGPKFTIK